MDATPRTDSSSDGAAADALRELALNLRWSWNHEADELWSELDAELWELTQNPWVMLQTVSREKLARAISDPVFERTLDRLIQQKKDQEQTPRWFQRTYETPPFNAVAYFSLEFMLSDALPIYSGGLGNVAGDQLKAASDLGVPVVGVSLLYQMGYFRQRIDRDGRQQALYPSMKLTTCATGADGAARKAALVRYAAMATTRSAPAVSLLG
jgi:glycogen phosphorylase